MLKLSETILCDNDFYIFSTCTFCSYWMCGNNFLFENRLCIWIKYTYLPLLSMLLVYHYDFTHHALLR